MSLNSATLNADTNFCSQGLGSEKGKRHVPSSRQTLPERVQTRALPELALASMQALPITEKDKETAPIEPPCRARENLENNFIPLNV